MNQWSKGGYKLSDETRKKISENTKKKNANESEESKARRRATIAKKVQNGEWHTSLAKNHYYEYNGVDLHCSWEFNYAKWLDENQIKWQRCKDSFPYEFEGKIRKYIPDFYLPEYDEYIEIKGYKTAKDEAKWSQFPTNKTLKVLFKKDLQDLGIKV